MPKGFSITKERAVTELCGALHLHTTCSDGGVHPRELTETARKLGLDYIVINDHMTLKARSDGFEGHHDGLLVIVGYEHNDANNVNHYLALGIDEVVGESDPPAYIREIKKAGGVGFLAHPFEKRHFLKKYPPYPWNRWDVQGFNGIEIWNQMSQWLENLRKWWKVMHLFHPRRFLRGIPADNLARWDEMNRSRFVSGIAGVDAHSRTLGFWPVRYTIFPLKVELQALRTHVLIDRERETEPEKAVAQIIDALKSGHSFLSNFRRGDARGTRIEVRYADGTRCLCGYQDVPPVFPAVISIEIPLRSTIRFIQDGTCRQSVRERYAEFTVTEPGVYRLEVYRDVHAWIYSNPIPIGMY